MELFYYYIFSIEENVKSRVNYVWSKEGRRENHKSPAGIPSESHSTIRERS